jgi:scyllo-inositol 2-dehydrogenase (NADP+)
LKTIVQRRGDEATKAYPAATVVRSVEEMLADDSIALVVVATPNETHFELGKQVLAAGKHVVIDKPLTGLSEQARELITLAAENGLVLAPFHNRRWDGDFHTIRRLVENQSLGRLVMVESHFDRFRPIVRKGSWKEEANPAHGLLFDIGPHLVDQAFALFGPPLTVTATVRTVRDDTRIEDAFDIALGYDRLIYWCRATLLASDPAPRFLLHGTSGSFKKCGLDSQEPALIGGATVPRIGEGEWGAEDEAMWGELTIAPKLDNPNDLVKTHVPTEPGDYRGFYANVRDAIWGVGTLEVSAEAGWAVIRALELARASSQNDETLAF